MLRVIGGDPSGRRLHHLQRRESRGIGREIVRSFVEEGARVAFLYQKDEAAAAETQRLIGSGELDFKGYLLCVLVVVVVASLCMITSRLGVIRVLKNYA